MIFILGLGLVYFVSPGNFPHGSVDASLGNYFIGVVKDNIGFFHLITPQMITWQFSKQLEPAVIIYCCHYTAGDIVKHQQHLSYHQSSSQIFHTLNSKTEFGKCIAYSYKYILNSHKKRKCTFQHRRNWVPILNKITEKDNWKTLKNRTYLRK